MKKLLPFSLLLFCSNAIFSQTLFISGQCIDASYNLPYAGTIDGKSYYESPASVYGSAATIDIAWSAADAQWQVLFDGQPYYYNTCNTAEPPYTSSTTCFWLPVTGQTCTGSNPLVIGLAATLPVQLLGFTAITRGDQVQLQWRTTSESNNKNFLVQRSADGRTWNAIGSIRGAGNSSSENSYQFIDSLPLAGTNNYRLLQIDVDGRTTTTTAVRVMYTVRSFRYTISNNPGSGLYTLNLQAVQPVQLTVLDLNGRNLISRTVSGGRQVIDLTSYTTGTYLLRFNSGGQAITEKLVKR